ncbi:VOC family protein [Erythrobacter sp. WG]|uniref:VOC family protein n=1 Tax=Erythrobacter sp. WG TaxID=2985510 RepID=UPI00226F23F8|nr:VOC family protein [Erythrobacter sp. WG]MCX9146411.1 VOC family protein [Erythrobacter sp. WG]
MRNILFGAAIAALLAGCAHAQQAPAPKAAGVEKLAQRLPTDIRRATIIVRDMEKSLALYRDVIGLQTNYDTVVETSGVALPAGEPGAKARLVLLNANDPWVGWLGLMQWTDPPIPAGEYPKRMGPGDVVLVLNTDDAKARCEKVKGVPGVTFTAEARLQVYPGRNGGKDIRVMGCNFFDPDGILVELNQILAD